jgi:lipopolysaccharide/colanic/teichoic acid biosynthesis glycosyltransferase
LFPTAPNNEKIAEHSGKRTGVIQSTLLNKPKKVLSGSNVFDEIRFFDVLISGGALVVLSPVFLFITLLIKCSSKGPAIFLQQRVGKNGTDFTLYKFRTMHTDAASKRSITIGKRDNRITGVGYFLRRFKLDELPQLYNVLKNDMSIVGPRPELRQYVNFYDSAQLEILLIKPGITDYASILFRNENEILAMKADPEKYYIENIIPIKIRLGKKYTNDKNLKNYFNIIFKTVMIIFI